ncbi:MAG TPA: TRZ/ATZ family hydrolase [Novimethylophilus sp.]|jgi:5-methylthioadenosine/S-adenosylhomocysteine deaminase|uniref:TRZ/ATZ family hydrolase n=1 Tax=Novimethylophilus sp. TaxID=2137426 RepID=UPI002F4049CB
MPELQLIDLLIVPQWIVPIYPRATVLEEHAVAVRDGLILDILPLSEARRSYTQAESVFLPGHALMPGLINLHTHAAMSLMRGLADDLPLMRWLNERIWPAESSFASEKFVHDGTLLACAEMLRGGTTCFSDMYFYPGAAAAAVERAGMRACLGLAVLDFPTPYAADADDYLNKGLAARDALRNSSHVTTCLAPHAPYTVSDRTFEKVLTYAEQLNLNIHTHLHETHDELAQSKKQHGMRPLQRMAGLGLLGPGLIAAHGVHLTTGEIELLAERGCHIAHCPTSNLKLASGTAPVTALLEKGVNVGLGSDGAASNNRLDMFGEMRLAALLAKGSSGNAETLPAWQAMEMATINAARALGMDEQIGTLQPGKYADMVALDLNCLETQPCYDVISHLVYTAGREQVSHVWVAGEPVLKDGQLLSLDPKEILERTKAWQKRLRTTH